MEILSALADARCYARASDRECTAYHKKRREW